MKKKEDEERLFKLTSVFARFVDCHSISAEISSMAGCKYFLRETFVPRFCLHDIEKYVGCYKKKV